MHSNKVSAYGIVIFILAAGFYLYDFILQISPGVMTSALMHSLHINALGLGILSSFYYYAYTPMQLPAGILYDRFGPRILLSLMVVICAVGALIFSFSHHMLVAGFGRLLMGGSSAFAFVGTLVLITRWFPHRYFALLVGITQFMGSMGAIVGEAPLAKAIAYFGWRQTLLGLGLLGLLLACAVWLVVRDWPRNAPKRIAKHYPVWHSLEHVLSKSQTWITAVYAFLVWAPITVFAALWGVPFLVKLYHISVPQAGSAISMIWLGVALGCPVLGWWSDFSRRRKPAMLFCAAIGIIALSSLLFFTLSLSMCYLALLLFGIAAAGQSISFGVVSDNNSVDVVGTAVGFNNMAIVAGGAIFQPLVSWLLNTPWHHHAANFGITDYRIALGILPICYLAAFSLCLGFLKESYKPAHA